MDGKQLKNSILQWAIQGKLVPQNPKDEPASKLLERIAAARNESLSPWCEAIGSTACHPERNAVKSKDLKKKKSAPTSRIYRENGVWYEQVGNAEPKDISDDIPFDIPENWAWCRLSYLVSLLSDGIHGTPVYCDNGPYYFINGNNLKDCKIIIKDSTKRISADEYEKYKKPLNENSILVSINGTIGNIGYYNGEPIILGKSACYFNLLLNELKEYITTCLKGSYFLLYALDNATGSTIKNVSLKTMNDFLIPLPPLAEQKRIVAKLEQVLPLADEYGAAQEQLDELNKDLPEALKKSILQQAIQGKLVPQNPKDEPAQKLLERITAARNGSLSPWSEAIGATKRSKKSSPTSRIYCENGTWYEQIGNADPKDISDEIPFEIPNNWVWCRLKEVFETSSGSTPLSSRLDYYKNGSVNWVRTTDLNNGVLNKCEKRITELAKKDYNLSIIPRNSICIAMYGGKGTIGKYALIDFETTINQSVCAIFPNEHCYVKFFFYYMQYYRPLWMQFAAGSRKDPNINQIIIKNCLVPIAPLAEQKRIVTKLEQLFKVL